MSINKQYCIQKAVARTIVDAGGQHVAEVEITTPQGVFRGVSSLDPGNERLLKQTARKFRHTDLREFLQFRPLYPQNTPSINQAMSHAIFMASAAVQRQTLLGYIQRLARRDKQSIPGVIFDFMQCGPTTVQVTIVAPQNVSDVVRQLLEFHEAVLEIVNEHCTIDYNKGIYVSKENNLTELLRLIWEKISEGSVRFLLNMHYNKSLTEEKLYPLNGQQYKDEQYIQMLNQLIKDCNVISIQGGYKDKSQIKVFQLTTKYDVQQPNERKIITLSDFSDLNDFFDAVIDTSKHKFAIDIRQFKNSAMLPCVLAVGCCIDQMYVGGFLADHSWARLNELLRVEEGGDFICGCEDWVIM